VKIQIYTMQTVSEAIAAAEAGVDYLGLTPSNRGLPGEISFATAREIADALKGRASRCRWRAILAPSLTWSPPSGRTCCICAATSRL
jgi:hypothetical protein